MRRYGELYDAVAEEKKKYVELKRIASHALAELTEQAEVLENELEIRKSFATTKDRLINDGGCDFDRFINITKSDAALFLFFLVC